MMNGTSEAAREIARVTIVHLTNSGGTVGLSAETAKVIATQKGLIPASRRTRDGHRLRRRVRHCQKKSLGNGNDCTVGEDFIRVRVKAPFTPITPLVSAFGSHTFDSSSQMQIP